MEYEALFTTVLLGVIAKMYRNDKSKEKNMLTSPSQWKQYLEQEEDDEDSGGEEVFAMVDSASDPADRAIADEMLENIAIEINGFKFSQRQVLALSVLYGYSNKEIVMITGTAPANIRQIVKRFRDKMKEELQ